VPIHVRANPGDYAEACLLPGDPLRAQYIAESYFDEPVQKNSERGLLGFTGISAASADIARVLFYIFVVIFLVLLILGLTIFRA